MNVEALTKDEAKEYAEVYERRLKKERRISELYFELYGMDVMGFLEYFDLDSHKKLSAKLRVLKALYKGEEVSDAEVANVLEKWPKGKKFSQSDYR